MADRVPFHHKHLPNYARWTKAMLWKWMHLHFPILTHHLTDKYKNRLHHLVIDTIYAVLTFVFVAANIGLGIWYFRYFTPAHIDLQVLTTSDVTSGKRMDVSVLFLNRDRDLQNVTIDVLLPDGFVTSSEDTKKQSVHFELGNLPRFQDGNIDLSGVVFGDVGQTYDARVIASYTSYGRRQYESAVRKFTVIDSSFTVDVDFPEAATYDFATPWTIHYKNDGTFAMHDVSFELGIPEELTVESVTVNGASYTYEKGQQVNVGTVEPGSEGTVELRGIFHPPAVDAGTVIGDQQVGIDVITHATILNTQLNIVVPVSHGESHAGVNVIAPRVTAKLEGDSVVAFGESIHAKVSVKNESDHAVDSIILHATTDSPATMAGAKVNGEAGAVLNGELTLPTIEHLDAGTEASFELSFPTQITSDEQVTSQLRVSGVGFSPDVLSPVPVAQVTLDTAYESQITVTGSPIYTGPNGEQIGYGPYPPQANEVTAVRIILRLQNLNNPLSGVHVHTTLPSQAEWTGLQSVSAGTTLSWNPVTRTVDWAIPDLDPQSAVYGAQFEIRFLPNTYQIGLAPHFVNDIIVSAFDEFTQTDLSTSAGAVVSPAVVAD